MADGGEAMDSPTPATGASLSRGEGSSQAGAEAGAKREGEPRVKAIRLGGHRRGTLDVDRGEHRDAPRPALGTGAACGWWNRGRIGGMSASGP